MKLAEIPGWEGYAVSDEGDVISFWRRVTQSRGAPRSGLRSIVHDDGRVLATFDRKDRRGQPTGYRSVCLSNAGKRRTVYVHEIVLLSFVGPRPSPAHEALHGNGIRDDNRLSNLRWGTVQENADDRRRHGRVYSGADHWRARRRAALESAPPESFVREDEDAGAFDDLLGAG